MTAAGAVDDATTAAARVIAEGLPERRKRAGAPALRTVPPSGRRIVTHRDIGAPYRVFGFAAPALGDRDFAAMLVVRALLGDVSVARSATTLGRRIAKRRRRLRLRRQTGVVHNSINGASSIRRPGSRRCKRS